MKYRTDFIKCLDQVIVQVPAETRLCLGLGRGWLPMAATTAGKGPTTPAHKKLSPALFFSYLHLPSFIARDTVKSSVWETTQRLRPLRGDANDCRGIGKRQTRRPRAFHYLPIVHIQASKGPHFQHSLPPPAGRSERTMFTTLTALLHKGLRGSSCECGEPGGSSGVGCCFGGAGVNCRRRGLFPKPKAFWKTQGAPRAGNEVQAQGRPTTTVGCDTCQ